MQIPLLYYIFKNDNKKENFETQTSTKMPIELVLYYLFLIYISTMVSVYATVLCWDNTKGSFSRRLSYATLANIFSVFYLIYHFINNQR